MDVQTKSLSSSIVEFFRKPIERRERDNEEISGDVSASNDELDDRSRSEMIFSDGQGSLILYETNTQLRPPILPILPIQRLRLLRQKQEWRRRLESNAILPIGGFHETAGRRLIDAGYRGQNSSTPSPVKGGATGPPVESLQLLKSRKVASKQRQGTKWSGDFDYDLSEYDNHSKEDKAAPNATHRGHIDSPTIAVTKMATAPGGFLQDANASSLSKAQRDILLKGQPSVSLGQPGKKETGSVFGQTKAGLEAARPDADKAVLPSIGFDFIKSTDTPSKTDIKSLQSKSGEQSSKVATGLFAPKPASTATKTDADNSTHHAREEEDDTEEPRRKKATRLFTDTTTPSSLFPSIPASGQDNNKPVFSFGKSATDGGSGQKPTTISSSNSKPLLSFAKPKESNIDEAKEKSIGSKMDSVPSFSFGAKSSGEGQTNDSSIAQKGSASSAAPKISFSFGTGPSPAKAGEPADNAADKGHDAAVSETKQAPTFVFPNSEKANAPAKPLLPLDHNGSTDKKDTTAGLPFGLNKNNDVKDKPAVPSFSFGSTTTEKKDEPVAVPSFSFNGTATSDKEDRPKAAPLFAFNNATSEKKDSTAAPSFTFGKGPSTTDSGKPPTQSISFGNTSSENKTSSVTPSFTFSKAPNSSDSGKPPTPSFALDSNTAPGKKDTPTVPSFSFGHDSSEKKETPGASFSFGGPTESEKKGTSGAPSFTFGSNTALDKKDQAAATVPSLSFGSGNAGTTKPEPAQLPSNGFKFNKMNSANGSNNQNPPFNFGATGTVNGGSAFGGSAIQPDPSSATNASSFTFNKAGPLANGNNVSDASGSNVKAGSPSFGFNFGTGNINNQPASAVGAPTPVANPFLGASQNNNGFAFNMAGNANSNGQPFKQTQPSQTAFGTTPSPAFGKSASPPAINGSNNSSRAFTPSNTINLNFGSNASVNPSTIFSGNPSAPNNMGPQQVFGSTPPPQQVLGTGMQPGGPFNNAPSGFGTSGGIAAGQLAQPAQQAPVPNFQLPPGRKLARMRQSRR